MGADIYDWDRVHGRGSYAKMANAQDIPGWAEEQEQLRAALTRACEITAVVMDEECAGSLEYLLLPLAEAFRLLYEAGWINEP